MKNTTKAKILHRMNYLMGHLKGVSKMIEEDKYCVDVIKQNQAVIAAIEKVNGLILESHLHTCVTPAMESKDSERQKKAMDEIVDIFGTARR